MYFTKAIEVGNEISEEEKARYKQFYPQISEGGIITPPAMFISDNDKEVSIIATRESDNKVIWVQPINIYQDSYTSSLLNSWNGDLTIDEKMVQYYQQWWVPELKIKTIISMVS